MSSLKQTTFFELHVLVFVISVPEWLDNQVDEAGGKCRGHVAASKFSYTVKLGYHCGPVADLDRCDV